MKIRFRQVEVPTDLVVPPPPDYVDADIALEPGEYVVTIVFDSYSGHKARAEHKARWIVAKNIEDEA